MNLLKWLNFYLLIFPLTIFPLMAKAQIQVVATGPDLAALVQEVGQDQVSLVTLARGSQNLHFLETKPSYMVQARRADLVVANGLGLETAWLPQVLRGARNPKVLPGSKGYLELGHHIRAIEIPAGTVSRSHGDVHPEGNPHWTLDPLRMGEAAVALAARLGELAPEHAEVFSDRAKSLQQRLITQTEKWKIRLKKTEVQKVITYHRTLNYFFDRFGIEAVAYLEPKPGIPPTAQHILSVIQTAKENQIPLILVEHYYDSKVAQRVSRELPQVLVKTVSAAVGGSPQVTNLDELYEQLVRTFEEAPKWTP